MDSKETKEKIDLLIEHAVDTNQRLDKIDENLREHLRRSKAAEERLDFIEEDVKPLLEHFNGFKWSFRALAAFTVFIKIWEFFKH